LGFSGPKKETGWIEKCSDTRPILQTWRALWRRSYAIVISTANTSIDSQISWKCRGKNFDDNAIKKTSSANNVDWSKRSNVSNVEWSKRSNVKNVGRRWRSVSNVDINERKSAKNVDRRWRSVSNVDRNERSSVSDVIKSKMRGAGRE
jgi:hypothetical protein